MIARSCRVLYICADGAAANTGTQPKSRIVLNDRICKQSMLQACNLSRADADRCHVHLRIKWRVNPNGLYRKCDNSIRTYGSIRKLVFKVDLYFEAPKVRQQLLVRHVDKFAAVVGRSGSQNTSRNRSKFDPH
jgi:hypothetical protein